MKTRRLGTTDIYLTTIGIGTWPMAGSGRSGWGPQDDQDSINSIRLGLERGINWIDTAPNYGLGHSEEVVGKAIKGIAVKPFISTKCLFMWKPDGTPVRRLDRERVRIQCENSLKRLDLDTIDMYMIHWPNPVEGELLGYCQKNGIGVIVYSPLQQGLLTGVIKSINDLAADDVRRRNPQFKEPSFSANLSLAKELDSISQKYGRSVAQLAIAWVLRRPEVTSAITGPRIPSEIEDTIKAGEWQLTKEDVDAIEKLLKKRQETTNSTQR